MEATFDDLPPDVLQKILFEFPVGKVANLCRVNNKVARVCRDVGWKLTYLKQRPVEELEDAVLQFFYHQFKRTDQEFRRLYTTVQNQEYFDNWIIVILKSGRVDENSHIIEQAIKFAIEFDYDVIFKMFLNEKYLPRLSLSNLIFDALIRLKFDIAHTLLSFQRGMIWFGSDYIWNKSLGVPKSTDIIEFLSFVMSEPKLNYFANGTPDQLLSRMFLTNRDEQTVIKLVSIILDDEYLNSDILQNFIIGFRFLSDVFKNDRLNMKILDMLLSYPGVVDTAAAEHINIFISYYKDQIYVERKNVLLKLMRTAFERGDRVDWENTDQLLDIFLTFYDEEVIDFLLVFFSEPINQTRHLVRLLAKHYDNIPFFLLVIDKFMNKEWKVYGRKRDIDQLFYNVRRLENWQEMTDLLMQVPEISEYVFREERQDQLYSLRLTLKYANESQKIAQLLNAVGPLSDKESMQLFTEAIKFKRYDSILQLLRSDNVKQPSELYGFIIDKSDVTTLDLFLKNSFVSIEDASIKAALKWLKTKQILSPFQFMVRQNKIDMAKKVLEYNLVDPSENNNLAIQIAAAYNHLDMLDLLMRDPRVNPADNENMAIKLAKQFRNVRAILKLKSDPRVSFFANEELK